MIDQNARQFLYIKQLTDRIIQGLDLINQSIEETANKRGSNQKDFFRNIQESLQGLFTKSSTQTQSVLTSLDEKLKALNLSFQKLDKPTQVNVQVEKVDVGKIDSLPPVEIKNFPEIKIPKVIFPDKYKVSGNVEVDKLPPVQVANFKELSIMFDKLNTAILLFAKSSKVEFPNKMNVQGSVEIKDWNDLLLRIDETNKGLNLLINKEQSGVTRQVEVINFPIPKIPQPVTNFNLNALRGIPLSSQISVLNIPTPLPANNLANRRTLIIYNNSSQTIYIGGSTVTVAAGFPIPPATFGPPIDAGVYMTVYGIAGSSGAEVRVLEVSNDDIGR